MTHDDRLKGRRAFSPEEKRAVVERLLAAWEKSPHERLLQFIENAGSRTRFIGRTRFNLEDDEFVAMVEEYVRGGK